MQPDQLQLLEEIMELEFAAVELNLYLDTHPFERKAISQYNDVVHELRARKQRYEMKYGPLANYGTYTSEYPWGWVEEPWPWEFAYRRD